MDTALYISAGQRLAVVSVDPSDPPTDQKVGGSKYRRAALDPCRSAAAASTSGVPRPARPGGSAAGGSGRGRAAAGAACGRPGPTRPATPVDVAAVAELAARARPPALRRCGRPGRSCAGPCQTSAMPIRPGSPVPGRMPLPKGSRSTSSRCAELLERIRQAGGAKNSRAMPSGSRKLRPDP